MPSSRPVNGVTSAQHRHPGAQRAGAVQVVEAQRVQAAGVAGTAEEEGSEASAVGVTAGAAEASVAAGTAGAVEASEEEVSVAVAVVDRRMSGRSLEHCAGVQPGGGRIMRCLKSNRSRLSLKCKMKLFEAKEEMKEKINLDRTKERK